MESRRRNSLKRSPLLIPPSIIDPASQRLFVISLFVLIQAWKIYDIVLIKNGFISPGFLGVSSTQFSFIIKYFIIDGLFLWSLPILNIPYLTFNPLTTSLQILLLSIITLFLASDFSIPITGILLPIWKSYFNKEVTLAGNTVNSKQIHDMNTHFKGKHTIKFLPDSSAKFNPFNSKFCLNHNYIGDEVVVPIEFNATQIGSFQLQHISPDNEVSFLNFTSSDIKRLSKRDTSHLAKNSDYKKDDKVFYLEVALTEPGFYKIHQVKDNKHLNIRSYKSNLFLPYCPLAKFNQETSVYSGADKCINDRVDDIFVEVFGVPPLDLKIDSKVDNSVTNSQQMNVQPNEDYTSSLTLGSAKADLKDLSWLKAQKIIVPLQTILTKAGKHEFHIDRIIDAFGNTLKYNPKSDDPDVFYTLNAHDSPLLSLVDPRPGEPIIIGGSKNLMVSIPGGFKKSEYPYSAEFEYLHPSDPTLNYIFEKEFSTSNTFSVSSEGKYVLKNARTKYCPCNIGSSEAEINIVQKPSAIIDSKPIIDKCAATTGYEFNFTLSGSPPYQILYEAYRNESNKLIPASNRGQELYVYSDIYQFNYRPPTEGSYIITFYALKDKYYKSGIELDRSTHTYRTYFTQKSKAALKPINYGAGICFNGSVSVSLDFNGKPPYSINYDVMHDDEVLDSVTLDDIYDNSVQLAVPQLNKGGDYKIKITHVSDNSNCDVDLENDEVKFKVRSDIPRVRFSKQESNIKVADGDTVTIPIEVTSSTWPSRNSLTYKFEDKNGDIKIRTVKNIKDLKRGLKVREEGAYSLFEFDEGGCTGEVENEDKIQISFYPKPQLSFDIHSNDVVELPSIKDEERIFEIRTMCTECEKTITLEADGEPPFTVDYEVKLPGGKIERQSLDFNSYFATFNLISSKSGRYEYSFGKIYDNHYPKQGSYIPKTSDFEPIRVAYDVKQLPTGIFDKKRKTFKTCQANLLSPEILNPIPIRLVGDAPFDVEFEITSESTNETKTISVTDIQSNLYELYQPYMGLTLGNHLVRISGVKDANGCTQDKFSDTNNVIISVTEVPEIKKSNTKDYYCVGDHISYNLVGAPPFSIYYSFNGKKQRAESGPLFSRLASNPGELAIVGLSDSTASCFINFTSPAMIEEYDDLKLQVFDMPSVLIDQGDYIVQDIHKGDQAEVTFSFRGIPPFKLTYTRTIEVQDPVRKSKKSKIVEREIVEDIWEYEYTILTDLEGTYEAIEIQDAFCIAKRELE